LTRSIGLFGPGLAPGIAIGHKSARFPEREAPFTSESIMKVLVTGAAGFIGLHVTEALLGRGDEVVGVDNMSPYYDTALKQARLARLETRPGFAFRRLDIADREAVADLVTEFPDVDRIVHLAGQPGVRYSLENPYTYVDANVMGQVVLLEAARRWPSFSNMVYASSSSVYGGNTELPFAVADRVDQPVSLYAATKRAGELIAYTYSHLHGLPLTGLRFFTVYGPWGRPDMAIYLFTDAIIAGRPIKVFNEGRMRRDFTYVDDIAAGVLAALDREPAPDAMGVRHRLYNLGNHRAEELGHFISVIEQALGLKAIRELTPMQPGEVETTYADIDASRSDLGFEPRIPIEIGVPRFVEWYRSYHGIG
jgi:UDP-glucuronate 4-epimerase